jgi:signal transduction histidine kinase
LENDTPISATGVRGHIHKVKQRASEIGNEIQAISHRLHSSKLRYLGILAAARSLCQEVSEQQKVKIELTDIDIPSAIPEEISLCLFRVLQEALHNAVKHSGVRHFEVHFRGASSVIYLTIRDHGVGFDPDDVMNTRGIGLISMRERIGLVQGTLAITSKPNWGTEITICIPLSTGRGMTRVAG